MTTDNDDRATAGTVPADQVTTAGAAVDRAAVNKAAIDRAMALMQRTPGPEPAIPSVLREQDLPGPLSLAWLVKLGTVVPLDKTHGFWAEYATTIFGRAQITATMTPPHTIACALSAAWVWLGGTLPDTVDVLSHSHHRAAVHGRRIRVYTRKTSRRQLRQIGNLQLTDPARTAVDLAANREDESDKVLPGITARIDDLMDAYHLSARECLSILDANPYMKTGPRARKFFEARLPFDRERAEQARRIAMARKEAMPQ